MIEYNYSEIVNAVRGKLLVPTRRRKFKGNVCIDSRDVKKGDLFVALKGPRFDGHDFIDEAFEKGARICIGETGSQRTIQRKDPDIIFVEDSLAALGRLGAFHRRKKNIPVIIITGSCGKTTTKELIAHLLSSKYKVIKNKGSENNSIGVPKTLLNIEDHDIAVVEIGTNKFGEVRHLTRMVNPTHAVLTMIGNAHLMGFRSIQGVKREKLSMIDALDDTAIAIYNGDDTHIVHPRLKLIKTIRAGLTKKNDVYAEKIELGQDSITFLLNGKFAIKAPLLGRHNVLNVTLAAATALEFGFKKNDISDALIGFKAPRGRLRHQEADGIHWIDDSYNSNPSSLKAAFALFKSYPPAGRKILILGDMLELGPRAAAFHQEAGRTIATYPFDLVLAVGTLSQRYKEEAVFYGFDKNKIEVFPSSTEAGEFLKTKIKKGDTILLKGSRGMHMERILELCGIEE